MLRESNVPTKEKEQAVEDLAKRFSESTIMITTDYSGLRVAQMTELRRAMRESGVEFRVIKNSLALMAADSAGKPAMKDVIDGPTGIAFGFGDASEPAKALSDFIRANRSALKIRGAELDGRALTPTEVQQLA
ncbi:MAG TPA: 50S ribosomal protein L10, partial [Dehalococcoidia bacterium]|nr:50S ribosomal protein L10 [Dehalococcoidia bacterium]